MNIIKKIDLKLETWIQSGTKRRMETLEKNVSRVLEKNSWDDESEKCLNDAWKLYNKNNKTGVITMFCLILVTLANIILNSLNVFAELPLFLTFLLTGGYSITSLLSLVKSQVINYSELWDSMTNLINKKSTHHSDEKLEQQQLKCEEEIKFRKKNQIWNRLYEVAITLQILLLYVVTMPAMCNPSAKIANTVFWGLGGVSYWHRKNFTMYTDPSIDKLQAQLASIKEQLSSEDGDAPVQALHRGVGEDHQLGDDYKHQAGILSGDDVPAQVQTDNQVGETPKYPYIKGGYCILSGDDAPAAKNSDGYGKRRTPIDPSNPSKEA